MLSINHINIQYENKCIYKNAAFEAYDYELTVIAGKSGIGKTTFLETLLFQHEAVYCYNNKQLHVLNEQQQKNFFYTYIGYVKQSPQFINELTFFEHIEFIKNTFQLIDLKEELLNLFNINHLLKKYPYQLSGGEKVRVSLYLSVLKNPKILILDEPTASLDDENKTVIIDFLKQYAKQGNTVICASHDQELMDKSDVLYEIQNKQLLKIKDTTHQAEMNVNDNTDKVNTFDDFLGIHLKMKKYHKFIQISILFLLSVSIAFVFISFSLNNAYIKQLKNELNSFSSKELIVYKKNYEGNSLSGFGNEFPLSKKELLEIEKIEGIGKIEWRYDMLINSHYTWQYKFGYTNNMEECQSFYGYIEKEKVSSFSDDGVFLHTYIDNEDYSSAIEKVFSEDGIYVSSTFFHKLFESDEIKNPYLSFYLMIPQYNSTGISFEVDPNSDENELDEVPANFVNCMPIKVNLSIRGIIKGNVLSQEDSSYPYHIYISQSDIQKYIDKYPANADEQIIYWLSKEDKYYLNEIPKGYQLTEDDQVIAQTRWIPNAYSIIVDDLSNMNNVVDQIKKMGFCVENQYYDVEAIMNVETSSKNMMIYISGIILIIILISYFIIQYMNRTSISNIDEYLGLMGYDNKMRKKFFKTRMKYDTVCLFLGSVLCYFAIRFILEKTAIAFIQIDVKILILMAIVAYIIEYIYPSWIYRKVKI